MGTSPLWTSWDGPRDASLVLVGEAWGATEDELQLPFCGENGKELFRMLAEAGLAPKTAPALLGSMKYGDSWVELRNGFLEEASCALTNVFPFRPPNNSLDYLQGSRSEVPKDYPWPAFSLGKYFLPQYCEEVFRLWQELRFAPRNLVLCLGNTACWAVLRSTNIGQIRGAVAHAPGTTQKVLATFHPSGVLRNWSWRPIVIADLIKAARQREFPEIRRPSRRLLINPTLQEIRDYVPRLLAALILSADTETASGQINCISLCESATEGLVIPFVKMATDSRGKTIPTWENVWEEEEEIEIWEIIGKVLHSTSNVKLGQNFIYDLQYLLPQGILPLRCEADLMLLHHSIFPEMKKGLGFLGSIYTDEASWKLMRRKRSAKGEKSDE